MANRWIRVNQPATEASTFTPTEFTLSASPKTDVYASPLGETLHVYSAPIVHASFVKSSFRLARVSFSFTPTLQFDQGGLLFTIPTIGNPEPAEDNANTPSSHPAWVKIGIETNDGEPCLSVVGKAKTGWCDWSLAPLPVKGLGKEVRATVEVTRVKNALMVYFVQDETRTLTRKIPWVFLDDVELSATAWVGAYAARPDPDGASAGKSLLVSFRDLHIENV
ncbi:putative Beta-xylosidase C-terminal Concanavalin A-like domain-containing protein [Seiridium unicorne]|uniref:Beta-xylosidase C-terminal Concanavalin A-like domain-containing protein n=1 Tax=Seiridium unicorne TaxID=138068 RepID=A0ABR2VDQ0_9PEZI